jgi:hypothetical protein
MFISRKARQIEFYGVRISVTFIGMLQSSQCAIDSRSDGELPATNREIVRVSFAGSLERMPLQNIGH